RGRRRESGDPCHHHRARRPRRRGRGHLVGAPRGAGDKRSHRRHARRHHRRYAGARRGDGGSCDGDGASRPAAGGRLMAAHRRERSVALAIAVLGAALALVRPAYFSPENLVDLLLSNLGVMTTAIGTTLVVLTGEIDISVGSVFAIASVAAGVA